MRKRLGIALLVFALAGCGSGADDLSSLTCGELRDIAENTLLSLSPNAGPREVREALENEDRARARMDELGCFEN
jgi:hypothetical protein